MNIINKKIYAYNYGGCAFYVDLVSDAHSRFSARLLHMIDFDHDGNVINDEMTVKEKDQITYEASEEFFRNISKQGYIRKHQFLNSGIYRYVVDFEHSDV